MPEEYQEYGDQYDYPEEEGEGSYQNQFDRGNQQFGRGGGRPRGFGPDKGGPHNTSRGFNQQGPPAGGFNQQGGPQGGRRGFGHNQGEGGPPPRGSNQQGGPQGPQGLGKGFDFDGGSDSDNKEKTMNQLLEFDKMYEIWEVGQLKF